MYVLFMLWAPPQGFASGSLEDVLSVSIACLPHHTFASEKYLAEVARLKSTVMEGELERPAADVARIFQQVHHGRHPRCHRLEFVKHALW